jgi:carboxyl-terminal processing protease
MALRKLVPFPRVFALRALGLVLALACAAPAAAQSDCSVLGQNSYVRNKLQDIYFWYRDLPDLNPALSTSPEAYLEAVRYKPLDTTFSYITGRAANDAFYSDSQFIGFGFGTKLVSDGDYRVIQVFAGSPASEAGLLRGDRILAVGGRSVTELLASGELGAALGPSDVGYTTDVRLRALDGTERSVTMTKRLVTIPTVSDTRLFEVSGRVVGYVHFRNFVQPSLGALDAAFFTLEAAGASELVLDLRYNGGGLVSVAQYLAGLIGGYRTNGQLFTQFFHNDKNSSLNQVLRFDQPLHALSLERVVVITTRSSASASELVINSLRPFIKVVIVGDTTYGKPVGQYGFNFCDKVLYPVAFTLRNAVGYGDFFSGFPPDCAAADDVEHQLAEADEASLAEALHFIGTGTCSAGARTRQRPRELRPLPRESGWQQLLGAY